MANDMGGIEVVEYSPRIFDRPDLLAVAVARPHTEIYPGIQSQVLIDDNGPYLEQTGTVWGEGSLISATGRLITQIAYNNELPPGHAGINYGSSMELLASRRFKNVLRRVPGGSYIGYFCMVDTHWFAGSTPESFGNVLTTRRTAPVELIMGVTVANINELIGPGGLDRLRDTIEHPVVRQHFISTGLRSSDLNDSDA